MTPWEYTKLWVKTAVSNTELRTGRGVSVVVYTATGFIFGTAFYFWLRGFEHFKEEWYVWIGINLIGGIATYCVALIASAVTAPYQMYRVVEKRRDELESENRLHADELSQQEVLCCMVDEGNAIIQKIKEANTKSGNAIPESEKQAEDWITSIESRTRSDYPKLYARISSGKKNSQPLNIGKGTKSQTAGTVQKIIEIISS